MLKHLTVEGFRSISQSIELPLDASIVLVHGLNGRGKTSVLSAIELAMTGEVSGLARADASYLSTLTHVAHASAVVQLDTAMGSTRIDVSKDGAIRGEPIVSPEQRRTFAERCVLAQSVLGRFLEVSAAGHGDEDSALVRFAKELLHLDELDALVAGLEASADLRNARKLSPSWTSTKARLEVLSPEITSIREDLAALARAKADIEQIIAAVPKEDPEDNSALRDVQLVARAIRHQLPDPHSEAGIDELPGLERAAEALTQDFDRVRADLDEALTTLSDLAQSAGIELNWTREPLVPQLKSAEERAQMVRASAESQLDEFERASASASDLRLRFDAATSRLRDAAARENTLSQESAPDQLASALTQLLPMITGNTCPACGQDFALGDSLRAHIEERVEELSAVSVTIADAIAARISAAKERDDLLSKLSLVRLPTEEEWSELQFRLAQLDRFSSILRESLPPAADLDDVGKRRDAMRLAAAEANSRASLLHSGLSELSRLEQLVGLAPDGSLQERLSALDNVVSLRIARATAIEQSQAERELAEQRLAHIIEQEANLRVRLSTHEKVARRLKAATSDAERRVRAARSLRQEALSLRSQVISDVFDGRLNGLWADLFSRLAPDESFVPSFHITHSGARAVGVDLVSTHVSGAAAGRPGTVLSYGNANTAALTLFMSLHFAALDTPRVLLLDDPVQSMDEVHVSNFAALLRRVAYDNQRQVVVAVHERALFEYLQLELAPGEGDGELIAVEIAKDSPANPVRVQASTDNVTVAVAGSG